ncbi:MAG: hypothetical protein GWN01_09905 [Nitrosopumilaceae archaeon]|nr:hypothetical protein [Nitrosopumilaceae archaeon]NIX61821.1 hypothetical protein [Nitrosopumilaceae archaeon]
MFAKSYIEELQKENKKLMFDKGVVCSELDELKYLIKTKLPEYYKLLKYKNKADKYKEKYDKMKRKYNSLNDEFINLKIKNS